MKPASMFDLRAALEIKKERARVLKNQFAREGAVGTKWTDEDKRKEYVQLRQQIKDVELRIESLVT